MPTPALTCIRSAALALLLAAGTADVTSAAQAEQPAPDASDPAAHPPGSLGDRIVPPSAPVDPEGGGEEALPPIAKGEVLSERQIRYCMAEKARIDAVRPVLNRYDPDEVRRFNERVADFNARCSSYRFYGTARDDASAWLDSVRPRIEQEARDEQLRARQAKAKAGSGKPAVAASPPSKSAAPRSAEPVAAAEPATGQEAAPQPPPAKRDAKADAAQAKADVPSTTPMEPSTAKETPAASPPVPPKPPVAAATGAGEAVAAARVPAGSPAPEAPETPVPAPSPPAAQEPAASAAPTPEPAPSPAATREPAVAPAAMPEPALPSEAASAPATSPTVAPEPTAATPEARRPQPAQAVIAKAEPAPEAAPAATEASPESALAKLTQEVREVGTMVLPRPKDATPDDLTAQIEVRYAAGGFINSIVIAQSSGSPFLDEEALARARALRLPSAPEALRGKEFSVQFPVVFRSPR